MVVTSESGGGLKSDDCKIGKSHLKRQGLFKGSVSTLVTDWKHIVVSYHGTTSPSLKLCAALFAVKIAEPIFEELDLIKPVT